MKLNELVEKAHNRATKSGWWNPEYPCNKCPFWKMLFCFFSCPKYDDWQEAVDREYGRSR